MTCVQTVDSFMTYYWVCNKSNTTGDTCTNSGLIHDLSLGLEKKVTRRVKREPNVESLITYNWVGNKKQRQATTYTKRENMTKLTLER